jgi:penicillin-binding protein 2
MKHFRQLIFVACACLFCASAGCSFSTMLPEQLPGSDPAETPTPSPNLPPADEVALAFLQAWERADFPTMYSLLSPATQQAYPEDLFIAIHDQAYDEATILAVTPRLLASYQPDVHAQVAFSLAYQTEFAGVLDVQNQMELTFVEGRWGVDWSPALIFPQMNDGAQVRLTTQMPSRGNIYDRNGLGLAVQGQLVELGVVPSKIEDETGLLAQLAAALGEEPAEIKARYAALDPNWYVPLGRLSADDARDHFEALSATPGIEMRDAWARAYRPEQIAPHVVGVVGPIPREEAELWRSRGYTGDELVGWMGLERWGEPYLAGLRGGRLEIVDAQGQSLAVLAEEAPRASSNLYTTFDREFQKGVQEILGQHLGAIVVLEAQTGRVLALATHPTFDPNQFTLGISDQQWQNLQREPDGPLVNRCSQGTYPAGSVFKIITMAAGMGAAGLTAGSSFDCDGVWMGLGPELPRVCWLESGHGSIALDRSLTVSCDITFYQVGFMLNSIDPEALPDYAHRFGLGSHTGIEVEEEAGLVPGPAWKMQVKGEGWAPGDAVNLAIGQGELLVTPLQVAMILAAVGNGGTLYAPAVVEMIASDPENPEWQFEPKATGVLPVSAENLAVIQESLRKAALAADGTTQGAFSGMRLSVAGKTGTAESGGARPHAWFAGYAPASTPELAIAVVLENAGTGGEAAAPLFRQVVEAYFGEEAGP